MGWAIRLARTVESIHEQGRVHGRLSAGGVLVAAAECDSDGELLPFADLPENVAYHSPERERGEGGSQADDTWAVAVFLYYALSGSVPFSGASDDEVRRKIRTVPAPPLAVFDVGDDELQGTVDRALARSRDGRTQTVSALRRELEAWHPDLQLNELPPLVSDQELDEELTVIHSGTSDEVRKLMQAALAEQASKIELPRKPIIPKSMPPAASPSVAPVAPALSLPKLVDEPSNSEVSDVATIAFSLGNPVGVPQTPPVSLGNPVGVPQTPPVSSSDGAQERKPAPSEPAIAPASGRKPAASKPPASEPTPSPAKKKAAAGQAGTVSAVPPEPTPPRNSLVVIVVLVILALGAAAYFFTRGSDDAGSGNTRSQLAPTSAPSSKPTEPTATPEPAATPPPPASPAVTAVATASATAANDPTACVTASFSADSFDSSASFAFLCAETDAPKLAPAVRAELVRARKNITDGMRDWALLGWYDLPAVVALRTRCCPSAKPLHLPEMALCTPIGGVLDAVTSAAEKAADPTDRTLLAAVTAYTNDVYCIVRSGMGFRFGHRDNPEGGQDTTFLRFLGRFIKARPSR